MFNREIEVKNYFEDRNMCPLGMQFPIEQYMRSKEFPEHELVSFDINKNNVHNSIMIAPSGVGKGRHSKNIVKWFHKQGYKILVFDPKGYEFLNANKRGEGRRIHKYDQNETLPVVGYCPSYVESEVPETIKHKFKFYSHKISDFKSRELWGTLGMSDKGADFCVSQIKEYGAETIEEIETALFMNDKLMSNTKTATSGTLSLVQGTKFFNEKRDTINIKKHWDRDEIVSISYFSMDGYMMNTDIGQILNIVKEIGVEEAKRGYQNVTKKLIILDDALYYLDKSDQKADAVNLAIKNVKNAQNNWRSYGVNTMIIVQNPTFIDSKIVDGAMIKFISKINRPQSMNGLIPKEAYEVLNADRDDGGLEVSPDNYRFEWIYVNGMKWYRYYPFDCTVGH